MANNESNTEQNPESIVHMSEQSKKKKHEQTPIENIEKPKDESENLEQPNCKSTELEGQKGEGSLDEKPNVEVRKMEEAISGTMPDVNSELIGSGRKKRKRKKGKKGNQGLNEERKDGVRMVKQRNDGSRGIELLKRDIEAEERKDRGNEVDVGNFGQNPEHSGSSKKETLNGAGNGDGCGDENRGKNEMKVEEVRKDVEMLEVPRGGRNGVEVGDGVKMIEQGNDGSAGIKLLKRGIEVEERKDGDNGIFVGNNVGNFGQNPEHSGFSKKKMIKRAGNGDGGDDNNREKGEPHIEVINKLEKTKDECEKLEQPNSESKELEGQKGESSLVEQPNVEIGKIGEAISGIMTEAESELIGLGRKKRKRKRAKRGNQKLNEEPRDGVGMIEQGNDGSDNLKLVKMEIEVKERKDGGNEIGVGNIVGNFGKTPEHCGSSKKKMFNGVGNGDVGDDNRENGDLEIEEVKKDVGMLEVSRDESKGAEGGELMKKKNKKCKKEEQEMLVPKCFLCDATDHNAKCCPRRSEWFKNKVCLICRIKGHSLGNCPRSNGESRRESASDSRNAINNEDGPGKSKFATGSNVYKEKRAAKNKAKRKRKKEKKKQRELGTGAVENFQEQEKLEISK